MARLGQTVGGGIERGIDPFLHITARLHQHFAHLARHRARDGLLPRGQQVPDALHHLTSHRGRHPGPLLESALRGSDCARDVLGTGGWERPDQVARIGGIAILEALTRRRISPVTADKVLEL
jgi:hypothetical protein